MANDLLQLKSVLHIKNEYFPQQIDQFPIAFLMFRAFTVTLKVLYRCFTFSRLSWMTLKVFRQIFHKLSNA